MTVLHAHNVEGALHRDMAGGLGGTRNGAGAGNLPRVLADRAERLEAATVRAVDQTWLPSARDAELMAELYGDDVDLRVVPSGVDATRYGDRPAREPHLMVFPARFDYPPNLVAARRLSYAVLPAVRRRFAGARLVLVGGGALPELGTAEAVEAIGPVPEIAPFLARASIMPIALEEGGGTRLKVLEAFAAELPVVSTRKGVEGLDVEDGVHVLLADSDAELAAAVCRVWDDDALRDGLVERGAALVRASYGPEAVERAVAEALGAEVA
jgi:glycosyltransferase involved in cell wall biosynthesis